MTDITKLVDALDQLAELPKWTRFTEDESTWPQIQKGYVLTCHPPILAGIHTDELHPIVTWIYSEKCCMQLAELGGSWRPMNDYDYPPKEAIK